MRAVTVIIFMLFSLVTIAGEKVEREKVIRELVQQDIEWLS